MAENKNKILHVAQAAGGVDRYIRMLLKYLDKDKFENILVCSQDFRKEDYEGLADAFEQVEMERAIGKNDLKAIGKVRKLIKKYNPDIVYAHSSKAGAIARVADIGLKNYCVYNPHGWAFNMRCSNKKKTMYAAIEKIAAPFCDKIICISDAEKSIEVKAMISNQILQSTIDGLKSITRKELSVVEKEGKVIATTEENMIGRQIDAVENFISSPAESQLILGYQYFKIYDNGVPEYVIQVKGEDESGYQIGKIAAFQIQSLLVAYKERYDKDNFIKNLLLDNLLLVDIYSRAKKLHIENNVHRIVYLIETNIDKEMNVVEIVQSIFAAKTKDFVTAVDEHSIILVKELREKETADEIDRIAKTIEETLNAETNSRVYISSGTIVSDLKDVSRSYKEAKMALEVGKIFETDKYIVNYEKLGIGRLIYQLPLPLCRMFIKEVLHGLTMDDFDDETLATVNKFFENNLNVSETSRQLYIHAGVQTG